MLLSHQIVHAPALDATYASHLLLHRRFRVSIGRFENLNFDGSALQGTIARPSDERNWLFISLGGVVQVGAGGEESELRPGDCLVELASRADFIRYRSATTLTLEWKPGFLGSGLLQPGAGIRFTGKGKQALLQIARALQQESSHEESLACIQTLIELLRSEGLPFLPPAEEEVSESLPSWMRALSGALDRSLSNLQTCSFLELEAELGWSSATIRRRLKEFQAYFNCSGANFREILSRRRMVAGAALMGAEGAQVEPVASVLGYSSPSAFCDALAHAGLPSPGSIRQAAHRLG